MIAAICRTYGPVSLIRIEEWQRPSPKPKEIVVEVIASTVTSGDCRMRASKNLGMYWLPMRLIFGLLKPRNPVLGSEFSGRVVEVGEQANQFSIGDHVFGMRIGGSNAEFVAIAQTDVIALKPPELTFELAAAVPFGALSAFSFLRDFSLLQPGQRVLINGASGSVGVFAVQLAKELGADVTAVCSTQNIALVKSLGADTVIDYTTADFTAGDRQYDVIFDTVGNTSYSKCRKILSSTGRHVFLVFGLHQLFQVLWTRLRTGPRVICGFAQNSKSDLLYLKTLLENGKIRPVIDRLYDLHDIADAHRYVETGRKRGAVVLTMDPSRLFSADFKLCRTSHAPANIRQVR